MLIVGEVNFGANPENSFKLLLHYFYKYDYETIDGASANLKEFCRIHFPLTHSYIGAILSTQRSSTFALMLFRHLLSQHSEYLLVLDRHILNKESLRTLARDRGFYSYETFRRRKEQLPSVINRNLITFEARLAENVVPTGNESRVERDLLEKKSILLHNVFGLTKRESDVLLAFCSQSGAGRLAIANRLFVTPNTVKFHTHNLLRKLAVRQMNAAVKIAETLFEENDLS